MSEPEIDDQYERFLEDVLRHGEPRHDRTGVGTRSVFGRQLRYDLSRGFPRITTKYVPMKPIKAELLWFLRGEQNINWLRMLGVSIWDDWADENDSVGPLYGYQWRSWIDNDGMAIDQIQKLIQGLRADPHSRRHLVSAWNVGDLPQMALAPCHAFFQCYVTNDGRLSLQVYQRSADLFLGVPFNIASYALLLSMLAQQTDLQVGELIWTGGDCHIYDNHINQVKEQLERPVFPFPCLRLKRRDSIDDYCMSDIDASEGYRHCGVLRAPVAV
jgi:thymidylate synthase